MARSNACSELTRFWLEARHGCLITESVPVPVPYGQSDLDLVAIQAALRPIIVPGGAAIGPRLIVEAKDEHDWEPTGREFGRFLRTDVSKMGQEPYIPRDERGSVKFSMLRQAHFETAAQMFGTEDFDRLFVVHAIDQAVLRELDSTLAARRIYWTTLPMIVRDLMVWYRSHHRPTGLRHTFVGDLWHLLVGYCGFDLPDRESSE